MNMAFKLSLKKEYIDKYYYNKFITVCEKFQLTLKFNIYLDEDDEINEEIK